MSEKLTDNLKQTIRDEFVHGFIDATGKRVFMSVDALARKHDVSRATLYRHSSSEDWQGQKNKYQTELQDRIDQERLERMVEDGKRLDDTSIQIAQAMLGVVGRKIQKAMERERSDPNYEGMDSSVLSQLSTATANAQKIGKLALGQAQEISKVSANVSNPDAFNEIMDQLDELAASRSQEFGDSVH